MGVSESDAEAMIQRMGEVRAKIMAKQDDYILQRMANKRIRAVLDLVRTQYKHALALDPHLVFHKTKGGSEEIMPDLYDRRNDYSTDRHAFFTWKSQLEGDRHVSYVILGTNNDEDAFMFSLKYSKTYKA